MTISPPAVSADLPTQNAGPPGREVAAAARAAAVAVLQRVVEVLDLRRPHQQLALAVTETVAAQLAALVRGGRGALSGVRPAGMPSVSGPGVTVTTVRRVHIQLVSAAQAEVFGTLTCGDRVRAVAGRLILMTVRSPRSAGGSGVCAPRWVLSEFTVL